jgi:RNA polymerase sigma-70 factor (ECF subfamily)
MELYRRYGPALLRKAQRILQNRDDALDVVQGLFLDLLQRPSQAEADLPYLYRAVTHRCLNHIRNRDNRSRLLERHRPELSGTCGRCDDRVIQIDQLMALSRRLDPQLMEVLVYRYFDDMGQEEIAALIGTSRKTVGKRLQRVQEAVEAFSAEVGGEA